jgi:hypothetical protein
MKDDSFKYLCVTHGFKLEKTGKNSDKTRQIVAVNGDCEGFKESGVCLWRLKPDLKSVFVDSRVTLNINDERRLQLNRIRKRG